MEIQTDLDRKIASALQRCRSDADTLFDIEAYKRAFAKSARSKADAVLELLQKDSNPFRELRPVFLSIGGADGEELRRLLSAAGEVGILLEASRPLAEAARQAKTPDGKEVFVLEGDAGTTIRSGMELAQQQIADGKADFIAVTCHAVIHELFDRSEGFDAAGFFASIFADRSVSTWFTYREPGVPEKWPEDVLLSADCSPESLLDLAEAIVARHPVFKQSPIKPQVIGDDVRLSRTLAMEVVSKLFYLDDLEYELQERSTSVVHQELSSLLILAIGERAANEGRAQVVPMSSPSKSFQEFWLKNGIGAKGLIQASTIGLGVPESHTRIVAYRKSNESAGSSIIVGDLHEQSDSEIAVARRALDTGDTELLTSLLGSCGRQWIESGSKQEALTVLSKIANATHRDSVPHLLSHYLQSISELFTGDIPNPNVFSLTLEQTAASEDLADLFTAERMEASRKSGDLEAAVETGNDLLARLASARMPSSALAAYCRGVSWFLLANLLRSGGLYGAALDFIDRAEDYFDPGVASHVTERAHCHYARGVCAAMQGFAILDPAPNLLRPKFAAALIRLAASHAEWFTGNNTDALRSAEQAAEAFSEIDAKSYSKRAQTVAALIKVWRNIEEGVKPCLQELDDSMLDPVLFLTNDRGDPAPFSEWCQKQRPSTALGLLQFRTLGPNQTERPGEFALPTLLQLNAEKRISIAAPVVAVSLDECDRYLRVHMGCPPRQRVPLLLD